MNAEMVLGFRMISLLLSITPGAERAYVIASGIDGRRMMAAVCGLMSGHLLALTLVIAGVGGVVASHPALLSTLTFAGAAYLLWLGYGVLRQPAMIKCLCCNHRFFIRIIGSCQQTVNRQIRILFLVDRFSQTKGLITE